MSGWGYGDTATFTTNRYYPYQWSQEKTETNEIDGTVITGTLGQSEQRELTTETSIRASASITGTLTSWWYDDDNIFVNTFNQVATVDSENDGDVYYNLFGGNWAPYWLATRVTCPGLNGRLYFTINVAFFSSSYEVNNYGSNNMDLLCKNAVRPIVHLPVSALDLNTDYDTVGAWNLK